MDPAEVTRLMSQMNLTPQDMMNVMRQPGGPQALLQSAGGNNIGSKPFSIDEPEEIIEQIKSAKRRFKQENSLGPSTAPQTSRATLAMKFIGSRRYTERLVGDLQLRTTYKGNEAHVSRQPLDQLTPSE